MSVRKQIPVEDWQDRLQTLTSGNRGRKSAIAAGGMTIIENKPFRDLEYDPVGKGNDLVITLGGADDSFFHTVKAPSEIYTHQEETGEVSSIEIVDQNGDITVIRLLSKF
jgi:hypothetical protein